MDFVLNSRCEGNERHSSYSLSDKHRKKLAIILLGWESSLPTTVRHYLSKIQVGLTAQGFPRITVTVYLEGTYRAQSIHMNDEDRSWKCCFTCDVVYQSSYSASQLCDSDFCRNLPAKLSERLRETLEGEIRILMQPTKQLESMVKSLTQEAVGVTV